MITIDVIGIEDIIKKFKDFHKVNPRAISLAMNSSARTAQTASLLKMRKAWNIKAKDLKTYVDVDRASVNRPQYTFKFHSRPINLYEFGGKQLKKKTSYKIQKTRKKLTNSFIKGKGRNTFIFRRESREHIIPYFSITPSTMFKKEHAIEEFVKAFRHGSGKRGVGGEGAGFNKRYIHELHRLLKK